MNLVKQLVEEDELQAGIAEGLRKAYTLVKASYGPNSGNALLEQIYGAPLLSHDGVTNVRRLILENPIENMAADIVKSASEGSGKRGGDGTTTAVILAYFLYLEGRKLVSNGHNVVEVVKEMNDVALSVEKQLDKISLKFKESMIPDIAKVASKSDQISATLVEIFNELGVNCHINIEPFEGKGMFHKIYKGFYFEKGLTAFNLANNWSSVESIHEDSNILISAKRLLTVPDIAPILAKISTLGLTDIVIVAEIGPEALQVLINAREKGIISAVPVDIPAHEGGRVLFLKDLAAYTHGKVYEAGMNPIDFTPDMLGKAQKVIITSQTTLIQASKDKDYINEDVEVLLNNLNAQLQEATNEVDIQIIMERINRLSGKFANIMVGAPTPIEQNEVKLRIDDAVCAVQAAPSDGILPGGAVPLTKVDSGRFSGAYKQLIRILASNAGQNPESILAAVEKADNGFGFDFTNITEQPVDLLKAKIIDPCLIVKEIVRNATSAAAGLLSSSVGLILSNRDEKQQ